MKVESRGSSPAMWRLFGAAMVAGPLLLVTSFVAFIMSDGGLNADELGGALLVYAMAGLLVAAVGIVRAVEGSFPRAAVVLLVLAALGCAGGVGFGIDSIHAGLPDGASLEDADSAASGLALFVPGALFPLGFVALGVAAWRARIRPVGCGPLLALAAVLFPAGNIPDVEAIALASTAMFVVALVPLGLAWLRDGEPASRPADRPRAAASPGAGASNAG